MSEHQWMILTINTRNCWFYTHLLFVYKVMKIWMIDCKNKALWTGHFDARGNIDLSLCLSEFSLSSIYLNEHICLTGMIQYQLKIVFYSIVYFMSQAFEKNWGYNFSCLAIKMIVFIACPCPYLEEKTALLFNMTNQVHTNRPKILKSEWDHGRPYWFYGRLADIEIYSKEVHLNWIASFWNHINMYNIEI